jgi:hypothetical protein
MVSIEDHAADQIYGKTNFIGDDGMKVKPVALIILIILLGSHTTWAEEKSLVSPSAWIVQRTYEFDPVVDGMEVVHDYVIQNKGTGTLEVQKVKTD